MKPEFLKPYQSVADEAPMASGYRLIEVLDLAIEAFTEGKDEGVRHCLELLRKGLRLDENPELGLSLALTYQDCAIALEKGDRAKVGEILETLRGLWHARWVLEFGEGIIPAASPIRETGIS